MPVCRSGPWHVLCDNESLLRASKCKAEYAKCRVVLWAMPASSPDLNPVDQIWAWLWRHFRALDLAALQKKRKSLGKAAYQERVRSVCRSQKAQRVAAACARSFRKTCLEVVRKKGAASRG